MLGGVLGRYVQGGVTFKGTLLFSVYGRYIYGIFGSMEHQCCS